MEEMGRKAECIYIHEQYTYDIYNLGSKLQHLDLFLQCIISEDQCSYVIRKGVKPTSMFIYLYYYEIYNQLEKSPEKIQNTTT